MNADTRRDIAMPCTIGLIFDCVKKLRTDQKAFLPIAYCLLPAHANKFKNQIGFLYIYLIAA